MRCILDDDGGNQLVEQKRRKLFRNANIMNFTLFDNNEIAAEIQLMLFDIEEDDMSTSSI